MAGKCNDWVLDNGLVGLKNTATHIHILSAQPMTFADIATMSLGNMNFGAGNTLTGPVDRASDHAGWLRHKRLGRFDGRLSVAVG